MTPLDANLKHLYQRRALWFWYAWAALMSFPVAMGFLHAKAFRHGAAIAAVLACSILSGLLLGSIQREILCKPFSFCLPGHREIPRKFLLATGLPLNSLSGLCLAAYLGFGGLGGLTVSIAAACVGMAVFMSTTMSVIATSAFAQFVGFLPLVVIGTVLSGLHVVAEQYLLQHQALAMLVGVAVSWLAWLRLASPGLGRKLCGGAAPSILEAMNFRKAQRYRQQMHAQRVEGRQADSGSAILRFALRRMRRFTALSTARFAVGSMYEPVSGINTDIVLRTLLPLALVTVFFCYYPSQPYLGSMSAVVFVLPVVMGMQVRLPATPRLFLPAGRRERFIASVGVVVACALVGTLLALAWGQTAHLLAPLLPQFTIKGITFACRPPNLSMAVLPLVFMPLMFLCQLYLPDSFLRALPVMLVIATAPMWADMVTQAGWRFAFLTAAVGWPISLTLLYYHCMNRCLWADSRG